MLSVFMIMNPGAGQAGFSAKPIGAIHKEMRILEEKLQAKGTAETALATLEKLPVILKEKAKDMDQEVIIKTVGQAQN